MDHPRLLDAFGLEVLFETLAKHGGVDANDGIGGGVVIEGAAEDFVADLGLADFAGLVFENALGQIVKKVAEAGGAIEIGAGRDAVNGRTLKHR